MDNTITIIALYLLIVNIITVIAYGWDKARARNHSRRISEKTLWMLAALGGTPGALYGMQRFRHKTRKTSFGFVLSLILLAQVSLAIIAVRFFL